LYPHQTDPANPAPPSVSSATPPTPAPAPTPTQAIRVPAPPPRVTPQATLSPAAVKPAEQDPPVALSPAGLKILSDAADAAVATGAAASAPVVGTSATSASRPTAAHATGAPTSASMGRAMRKQRAMQGIDRFVVSRKHGKSFAVLNTKGYPEVLAIGSPDLNARIRAQARAQGGSLKQVELDDINEELRSEAEAVGLKLDLYPRVRPVPGGGVEIDLNDGAGTTVRLADGRVDVIDGRSTALFTRSSSALPLPKPADHGDYELLKR
jgi:hypothetical protein